MYRCCSCATRIGWLPAAFSSVSTPLRCGACGTEQHRRTPLLSFLAFYAAAMLAVIFIVVAQAQFPRHLLLDLALTVPLLAVVIVWESYLFRRGEMVATVRSHKRLALGVIYGFLAVLVAGGTLLYFKATP